MKLTEASLKNPVAVAVIVTLICAFGLLCLMRMPLQLFPDIERPQLGIFTQWRAASPQEIEAELLEPIESVLQGLPGVLTMEGNARQGGAEIFLTFAVGTDMRAMLVDVLGRLNRLPPLPRDSTPPVVQLLSGQADLTWYFVQQLPGTAGTIDDQQRFIQDRIVPLIEAVPGVAAVEVNGVVSEELRIEIDLQRAAALGVSIPQVAQEAARANDISGGVFDAGRKRYTLRFAGRYAPDELGEMILAWRDGQPVRLGDVATISVQRPEKTYFVYQNGNPAIGLRVQREEGANVLATLAGIRDVVDELRNGVLKKRGLGIAQSFDSGLFISRAINLLSGNLTAGVLLSIGCLWWFLRDRRATLLIASTIPVSLLATFIVLQLAGRNLNVISLAGMAFAVGMVMDAAIVVAENIVRLREGGMAPREAARTGAAQVGGALFASTVTTVAVFLPVLFMRDIEGQLFSDLALTVSIAVAISLLVAMTVLPAAASGWLKGRGLAALDAPVYPYATRWLMATTQTHARRVGWIVGLVLLPCVLTWALLPRFDYLPAVKRAAIDAFFSFPPSMGPAVVDHEIGRVLRERMAPYMSGEASPQLKNWYLQLWPGGGTIGARVEDESQIGELERIVRDEVIVGFPDTRAFAAEGTLFAGFGGSARAIAIHLQSTDLDALAIAAETGRTRLQQRFAGANVQAEPSPDAAGPELRVRANDRRLAEAGWNRADIGSIVRTLGDGLWLGEHFDGENRLPVILRAPGWESPEQLGSVLLATPRGGVLPLSELVQMQTTLAPSQLRRIDQRRSITLTLDPPEAVSLEEALAILEDEILPELRALLPSDASIRLAGSADRLAEVRTTMGMNFALALLVLFLLMTALFKSLKDSLFVMLTMPMALLGGVLGLRTLGLFVPQQLDLLSMIGFVMLLGMVINNAILLISQTRAAEAAGLAIDAAVEQALSQRMRPILIGALTGVVGALPMAVSPGPGAAIYRGLAAVTVGGVGLSLLFTLVLMPALLRLQRHPRSAPVHDAIPPLLLQEH